ncbi:glucosaminidase domain-containing protein [Flavobacteriaceae bacterium D16]|nr:glucosaminidase domain-containing protein [Flavobacteriaceae bacterium D16]
MRKLVWLLGAMLVLQACGTKKRTVASKNKTRTYERGNSEGYPMPSDTGKFIVYDINSVEEYIETFAEVAKLEMKAYGIPASITLAQGILESGIGKGELTQKTNNHFGIKCHTGWDGEYAYHDDDRKGECFRKYNHPMYSFRDHSIFLSSRSRYASLFRLRRDDYKGWARGLKAAGYATDRKYPQKLIGFIENYRLYRFDREVLREGYSATPPARDYEYTRYIVKKGDTLYSISRRYYVSVEELMELNKMNSSQLSIGQELKIKTEKLK